MPDELFPRLNRSEYLETCARIRGIKTTALIRRLMAAIDRDQMVSAILDDADNIRLRNKSEHRYQGA